MDNGRSWKPCFCSCATAHCSGLPSSFRPWMEGQNEKEYTPEFQYGIRIIESEHLPNYIFNLNLHIQSRNELGLETPLAVGSETVVHVLRKVFLKRGSPKFDTICANMGRCGLMETGKETELQESDPLHFPREELH